jgi:hypoxanthine phosphoribosyltransferase|tara:strand:- start:2 stop:490 length:489 start_codon:yes stop_codon:yes gene_type:complete
MKRVLYLHGLESKQGGEKVDYLASKCIVHAPEMDYTRSDVFSYLYKIVEDFKPDVIVGSSMGGYLAYVLGSITKVEVIAFNPAFHSRAFDPIIPDFVKFHSPDDFTVILGEKDTVIDCNATLNWIKDHTANKYVKIKIERINTMGHRVTFAAFCDMYNQYIK